jgi:hypothetical protein
VRVIELGDYLDLAEEPLGPNVAHQILLEDLDCYRTTVLAITGEQHGRHRAPTELTLDIVPRCK